MTALIIIASLIALLVILLNFPVVAHLRFYEKKLDVKVTFAGIPIYPRPPKKEKKGKGKNKPLPEDNDNAQAADNVSDGNISDDNAAEENADNSSTNESKKKKEKRKKSDKPLLDRINSKLDELTAKKNAMQLLLELVGGPLKKFFGKLRIDDIIIDFDAADEDAYNAAMLYGKLNAAVYNAISLIRCFISISVISVTIDCLYNTPAEKCRFDGELKAKLRPASLLNFVFAVIFRYLTGMQKYSPILALWGSDKPKSHEADAKAA